MSTNQSMTNLIADGMGELERILSVGARHSGSESFKRWCAERLWIKTKAGEVVPFQLWPMQRRYLAAKRRARMNGKPPRFLLLKYRRGGFTTLEQAASYRLVTTRSNMNTVTLADTADKTAQIFRMSHMFFDRDPEAPPIKGDGGTESKGYDGYRGPACVALSPSWLFSASRRPPPRSGCIAI